MFKKNQIFLLFLTVVALVAVWYFKSPITAGKENQKEKELTTTRLEIVETMRDSLRSERLAEVNTYNTILASSSATVTEKEQANRAIKELSSRTEKEVLLEIEIINLGYRDCFVHSTKDTVEVLVVDDDLSAQESIQIIDMVNLSFVDDALSVIVNYKTAEELNK